MIVGYLIHDKQSPSMHFCLSLTRFAATQHLHETSYTHSDPKSNEKYQWPKPLWRASNLGYLPSLVIYGFDHGFSAGRFSSSDRREFSRLENVQVLSIFRLDLASFIPEIKTHFGQFFKTLRSLTLMRAKGSSWQLAFFVRSFLQLENLELDYCVDDPQWTLENDPVPVSSSAHPSLGGWFKASLSAEAVVAVVFDLPGGLHFLHMNIVGRGTRLLLDTCLETVETLELNALNICGEIPL